MIFQLILTIFVTNALTYEYESPQYYQNYDPMQGNNYQQEIYFYEPDIVKPDRYDAQESHEEYRKIEYSTESRRRTEDYDDDEDEEHLKIKTRCLCSCDTCDHKLRKCCKEYCGNCNKSNNVVLVAYPMPYPVVMPSLYDIGDNVETSSTTVMNNTSTRPNLPTESYPGREIINGGLCPELPCYLGAEKHDQNVRNDHSSEPELRRKLSISDWIPRYGVIAKKKSRNVKLDKDGEEYVQPNRKVDKTIYRPGHRIVYPHYYIDGSVDEAPNELPLSTEEKEKRSRYLGDNVRDINDDIVITRNHTWYIS